MGGIWNKLFILLEKDDNKKLLSDVILFYCYRCNGRGYRFFNCFIRKYYFCGKYGYEVRNCRFSVLTLGG